MLVWFSHQNVLTYYQVFLMFVTNKYIMQFVKWNMLKLSSNFKLTSTSTIWSHSLWFKMVSCSPVRHTTELFNISFWPPLLYLYFKLTIAVVPPLWFNYCLYISPLGHKSKQKGCSFHYRPQTGLVRGIYMFYVWHHQQAWLKSWLAYVYLSGGYSGWINLAHPEHCIVYLLFVLSEAIFSTI